MPKFLHSSAAMSKPEHYRQIRAEQRRRYYAKTAYIYEPRPWAEWEDRMVLESEFTDRELSAILHRSMKAISTRRSRLRHGDSPRW